MKFHAIAISALFASTAFANDLPGFYSNGGSSSDDTTIIYDTGADVTSVSTDVAGEIGLDLDNPDGMIGLNEFKALCFEDVTVVTEDSHGTVCVTDTTVYVSPDDPSIGQVNLLGRHARQSLGGKWDDVTEEVTWTTPGGAAPLPPPIFRSRVMPVPQCINVKSGVDSATWREKQVVPTDLTVGNTTISADLAFSNRSNVSFISRAMATALGATSVGWIDLQSSDPDSWNSLYYGGQNSTAEAWFEVVQLDDYDLGIGPAGGSIQVLVIEDWNSEYGLIGDDMMWTPGNKGYAWYEGAPGQSSKLCYE